MEPQSLEKYKHPALELAILLAQHGFAAGEEILEGGFEITGVPGIGDIASRACIGHQEMDFAFGIFGDDTL